MPCPPNQKQSPFRWQHDIPQTSPASPAAPHRATLPNQWGTRRDEPKTSSSLAHLEREMNLRDAGCFASWVRVEPVSPSHTYVAAPLWPSGWVPAIPRVRPVPCLALPCQGTGFRG